MSKPMTTEQAQENFECKECKDGGDCGYNCVESCTCSLNCTNCKKRVWFQGDLGQQKRNYACPYCFSVQHNKYVRD